MSGDDILAKLADEARQEQRSRQALSEYIQNSSIEAIDRLIDFLFHQPNPMMVSRLIRGQPTSFSQQEIVAACQLSKDLVVEQVADVVMIGHPDSNGFIPRPSTTLSGRSAVMFVQEHSDQWVVIPDIGCTVVWFGLEEDSVVSAVPYLEQIDLDNRQHQGELHGLLLMAINHALGLQVLSYPEEE